MPFEPSYIRAHREGRLSDKIETALRLLRSCSVCPRRCGTNRFEVNTGFCRAGRLAEVSSASPHFGEEAPLVGRRGSGTIFMTHCNLGCLFCQNASISHAGPGQPVSPEELAAVMIDLQSSGCHNINLVSPSHYVPQILEALPLAVEAGLSVPLVYNTGGYDALPSLELLKDVVDIYMPDLKYSRSESAARYSGASDYPEVSRQAVRVMHRQVGDLVCDHRGIALRGLLVRHLVLPGDIAGSRDILRWLAGEISPDTYVNVMDQYYPCGDIPPGSPLGRRITGEEYAAALAAAEEAGLTRLDSRRKRAPHF